MTQKVTLVGADTIGGTLAPVAEPVLDALARGRGLNLAFWTLP